MLGTLYIPFHFHLHEILWFISLLKGRKPRKWPKFTHLVVELGFIYVFLGLQTLVQSVSTEISQTEVTFGQTSGLGPKWHC